MQKLFKIFALLILGLFLVKNPVLAQSESTASQSGLKLGTNRLTKPEKQSEITNNRMDILKNKANNEINRRTVSLKNLLNKINQLKRLTSSQKAELTSQVQTEINNLNNLSTKISEDADLETIKTDSKSIIDSYRIYALFMPKIQILIGADSILNLVDKLTDVSNKLSEYIQKAQSEGKDVSSLNTYLTNIKNYIEDAKKQANNAQNLVLPLAPSGYPENKSSLENARSMLKTARQDLIKAHQASKDILQVIRTNKPIVPTPSNEEISPTPLESR